MTDIKKTKKKVVKNVEQEIETVAHNTVHPEDETDKEARKRQPWMPIVGAVIAAIILITAYAFFYR